MVIFGLGFSMLACTPAQRRDAGAATAGLGLATVCVAGFMADPCIIHDDELARRDCRRDNNTPHANGAVLKVAGVGAGLLAVGGILHLSGHTLRPRKVRPWRFKSDSALEPASPLGSLSAGFRDR
jgi:hypothetical protein